MRSDESHVPDPVRVTEFHDKSVFVTGNIENDSLISYYACIPEKRFDVMRTLPFGSLGLLEPGLERLLGIGVSFPEIPKGRPFDDSHLAKLACSQFGNKARICKNT